MKRLSIAVAVATGLTITAVALAQGALSGSYTTKITRAPSAQLKGTWTLKFGPGTKYSIAQNGHVVVNGVATYEQGAIRFVDKSGPAACKASGSYRYILGGKSLTFVAYTDTCSGRKFVLTHKFTRAA
jgi:hypothetical protein